MHVRMMHQFKPAVSIQGLWQYLACPRRQNFQCPSDSNLEDKRSSALVASVQGLPEVLQAHVLMFTGNAGASSLCLASPDLYRSIWQNREFWQACLASTGVQSRLQTHEIPVSDLLDRYRWQSCGIDALCRPGIQSVDVTLLKQGRCAVRGLIREDASFMDLISMGLSDLIRWYDCTDESQHHAAQTLLQDIKERSHLFSSDHMRDIFAAFDSACSLRDLLLTAETELCTEDNEPSDDLTIYNCLELLENTSDMVNASDDPETEFVGGCDDEAGERILELLKRLPDDEAV